MKVIEIFMRGMALVIILMLVMPPAVMAQDAAETDQPTEFTSEELAQMLAPIALYPDSVVAAVLMASTYPVEVVEAERWLKENENLTGDELDQALQEKTWDSSVKTVCHFPTILYAMSDDLERTTRMGEAFLAQQDAVMNMIQELRRKAEEEGNLRTTNEQKVVVEQGVIQIEPADPAVIYLPVYDPLYVYGPWWYPAYPPYYWYYPSGGIIASSVIGFGFGIFIGAGISSWCWPDWHHHRIDIDIHKTGRFNRFDRGSWNFNRHVWTHNPVHRRGAAYRFSDTGRRYGEQIPRMQRIRPEARGYEGRRQAEPSSGTIQRRQAPATGTYRQGTPTGSSRSNIFQGVGQGSFERRSSERGSQSRQSGRSFSPSGGGTRSGTPGGAAPGGSRSGGSRSGGGRR